MEASVSNAICVEDAEREERELKLSSKRVQYEQHALDLKKCIEKLRLRVVEVENEKSTVLKERDKENRMRDGELVKIETEVEYDGSTARRALQVVQCVH